jgi:hypothetical protein
MRDLWGNYIVQTLKKCIKCELEKPMSRFATRENLRSCKSSYRSECRDCSKDKSSVRKLLEKNHPRPINKDYHCPICDMTEKELKKNDRWSDRSVWCIDHDHITLEFRGWICNNCNIAIGRLHDDYNIALRAYNYLYNFKSCNNIIMDKL